MEDKEEKSISKIKHLVFSGGGPAGLVNYGALKYLAKTDFWNLQNIKSIYGCSIGAFMGIVVSLGYEWEWLDDYFIKRPWEKVFAINAQTLLSVYEEKGLIGEKILLEAIKPLLCAKDLNETCTLKELYEFNKIDIHIYTTNINSKCLSKVDLSHKTHPDLSVIKALCMTTSYPLAFKPVCSDGDCFIDGGLLNNFPLNDCLEQEDDSMNPDDILAFKNIWNKSTDSESKITNESSILDYMIHVMKKMQYEISTESKQREVKNIVRCELEDLAGFSNWLKALSTADMRKKLIENGEEQGKIFLSNIKSNSGNE
jgi:predicted acylesterase/phospholipase RssA